jgi:deoxycytidine triphosphate deaminase
VLEKDFEKAISTYPDDNIPSGMLSSPHIAYCIKKYRIIQDYDMACLGPATYDMRIGGKVLTWEKGEKIEFTLGEQEDKNKNVRTAVELRPNSLTFVTTIEKFNLPRDIIARFNLKSKWVHEGLLLGTGPIVDPELKANLLIPLHNFSSQNVSVHYADKIISVEFTKTLDPNAQLQLPPGEKFEYIENKSRIFDFDGYRKRIGGKRVESSVSSKFDEYDKAIKDHQKSLVRFSWIGGITLFGTFVGLIVLVFTTWGLISSARTESKEAGNIVKEYKEQNVDFRISALKSTVSDLQRQLSEQRRDLERLNSEFDLRSGTGSSDLRVLREQFENRMKTIEGKIKEIENKLGP